MRLPHRLLGLAIALGAAVLANPVHAFGIRAGFDGTPLGEIDDGSVQASLGFSMEFGNTTYSTVWVNNNGNATFDNANPSYAPGPLSGFGGPILAPFFADVDATDASNLNYLEVSYGTGSLGGRNAFGITWRDVGYYFHGDDKLNTFQLIIIDRADRGVGEFDVEFNYEKIEWEVGDVHGSNGLANDPNDPTARVGFSDGQGNFYELDGSGTPGALLDGGSDPLVSDGYATGSNGNYLFTAGAGVLVPEPGTGSLLALGMVGLGIYRRRIRR